MTSDTTIHRHSCTLCEGMCGIKVEVRGEQVIGIRPDADNVFSRGHICPKGTTLGAVHHDPDRLRRPMIRSGSEWRDAGWDEAFAHIEQLVAGVRERHGPEAFAFYSGNMNKSGFDTARYLMLLAQQARFAQRFSSSSVDQLPKNVSTFLMYGDMWKMPIPDVDRTDLFVIFGGNPSASKGSMFSHRDVMGAIKAMRARGGRLVVVDPVRTGTAQAADQWIGIRPGADAALLMAIVQVLFADGLVRLRHLDGLVNGVDEMRRLSAGYTPERVSTFCGVAPEVIRTLAREIAAAPRAAIYGRIGTCTQEFGTLASWLVDVVAVLTGNLDREGGTMWSDPVAPHLKLTPPYRTDAPLLGPKNRVRGVPGILGNYPASCLAEEIDTPGSGAVRGLLTSGCNPVLSAPGSARLDAALPMLECMVSIDLYINETTRHAHVILPPLSPLEQPHYDVWSWPFSLTVGGHYSAAIFPPKERPAEWRVLARLGSIFGGQPEADLDALDDAFFARMCQQLGLDPAPVMAQLPERGGERILDLCIRTGPLGDRFGENPGGLSLQSFRDAPDGLLFGHAEPQGAAAYKTPSKRLELAPPYMAGDLPRLEAAMARALPEFVLVSRRNLRSLNSWMHNMQALVKGRDRCTLQIHTEDAARLGIGEGDTVEVTSDSGTVHVAAEPMDDIRRGVVSLPHGWGHGQPGSRMATAAGHPGVNYNLLSPGPLVDAASGNAMLNGIPVRVAPVTTAQA
ncbi:molybdopterin-dependent oxidoreductase [Pelomonas sp. KK5]|uniref:molybdopterin-dependent oxidoreductase n=1 Tax=Pelomonas sp. KK5 TaxID=1855730 RepID=UPI00097CBD66|nr:molybdopterin-dependent oxidoreductase [Pelomonas sp. KK5]